MYVGNSMEIVANFTHLLFKRKTLNASKRINNRPLDQMFLFQNFIITCPNYD